MLPNAAASGGRWSRRREAWRRRLRPLGHRLTLSDGGTLLALCAASVVLAALSVRFPMVVPAAMQVLVVLAGGYLLRVRSLLLLFAVVATALPYRFVLGRRGPTVPVGTYVLVAATAVIVLSFARSRARLGLLGTRGESMLVDLRDRLRAQGEMPDLGRGWQADVALSSAGGAKFSGDFLVATCSSDGERLELALVDVSGKGASAGTRALLLSGAFGGLLGAMPETEFLPAANHYLLRQGWDEGFATAVHLALDTQSGDYVVTIAGHPPPAQFFAGAGRWQLADHSWGPLLGVLADASYAGQAGRLERGDALLLYTDGLVETPGRDLSVGIDRLLGEAERLVPGGFDEGARRLVDAVAVGEGDDRAAVLVWRT